MDKHIANVDPARLKVDVRNQAILVPADIENVASPHSVGARICFAKVREVLPSHALDSLMPPL
jgi:hypothetical protein